MTLSAPIWRLKHRAKQLSRKAGIPLHEALDRVAREDGFESWGLLAARNPATSAPANGDANTSEITALPLGKADRAEFVATANRVFETVLARMEPEHPEATRRLWSAEHYVDNLLLTEEMLPISRGYALSLIDAFLVHHVIDLAVQADKQHGGR